MVINRPSNNSQNSGVDSETTRDVLNRLDRTIRILEGELAKPNPFDTRSQLIGQLREAKALKVSLETAVQTGALTMNQPLFNNRGMPTAEPGSFIEAVLKRAEAAFGLFSNQFSINNGGFGPFGPDFKFNNKNRGDPFAFNNRGEFTFNNGFSPYGPNFKPSNGMPRGEMPAYLYKSREELAQNQGRGEGEGEGRGEGEGEGGFAEPRGAVGSAYPGLNGYIFGKDGTTPVQIVAARPVPHMWPHTDAAHYIYDDSLTPAPVKPGMKVPGTVKTYYGAAPLELGGGASMNYPDGTYAGLLENLLHHKQLQQAKQHPEICTFQRRETESYHQEEVLGQMSFTEMEYQQRLWNLLSPATFLGLDRVQRMFSQQTVLLCKKQQAWSFPDSLHKCTLKL